MVTRTARSLVGDTLLTGLQLLAGLGTLPFIAGWATGSRPADALAVVLVIAAAGSAALRRWPLISFGVATIATSAYLVLSYSYRPVMLSVAVAAYTLARHLRLRVAVVATAVGLVVLLAHLFTNDNALALARVGMDHRAVHDRTRTPAHRRSRRAPTRGR